MKGKPTGIVVDRRLLTGEFHPTLEEALLEHLTEWARTDPLGAVPVVVPTNLLAVRLSRRLAEGIGGHTNVRFMTMKDFARSLAGPTVLADRAVLPPHSDEIVVRRLIDDGIARDGYFGAISDRPGLAAALAATIRDLKEASYNPDTLAQVASSAGLGERSRSNKLGEFVRIWRGYEDFLRGERWIDEIDLMQAAAERTESGHPAAAAVVVYGFYDLNALQKRLISAYARCAPMIVFLPFVDCRDFDYARPTLDWFRSIGFEPQPLGGGSGPDLPVPSESVVVSAPGEPREAREDVRLLARILDERSVPLQDVAVIMRSPEKYSGLFVEELEHLGAQPYIENPMPLSQTRPGRALLKLADAVRSDFSRTDVAEFLALAELALPETQLGGETAPTSDWSLASSLAGITKGAEAWRDRLTTLAKRLREPAPDDEFAEAHGDLSESIESLRTLLGRLLPELVALPSRGQVSEFVERFLGAYAAVTADTEEREGVLSAVRSLVGVSPLTGKISLERFLELVHGVLEGRRRKTRPFEQGGPALLSAMNARGLRHRVVIVPGLVEKEFPLSRRQDPILLDAERERLNRTRGGDPLASLPIKGRGTAEERLLFRLAVSSASEIAILSFPRLDPATARPRVASYFLLRAMEALTGIPYDYEKLDTSPHVKRIPLSRRFPKSRRDALTREEFNGCSVLSAIDTGDPAEIAYLIDGQSRLRRLLEMEETRWKRPFFTRYDGVLSTEAARDAARGLSGYTHDGPLPGRTIAATALEEYARCPFRFMMRHVLSIEPLEEPEDPLELPPLDRGRLYHRLLQQFLRDLRSKERLPLGPESRDDLVRTAVRLVRSGPWISSGLRGAQILELRALLSNLALWLAHELSDASDLVPAFFEARFGGRGRPGDDPLFSREQTVAFSAAFGVRVEFAGRIDRIDMSEDAMRARVVDYKTGKPPRATRRSARDDTNDQVRIVLDRGRRLQLPVYLKAARAMFADASPKTRVESVEYHYITGERGTEVHRFAAHELDEREEAFRTAVGLIVRGIAAGMYFPYPEEERTCAYCEYADACGPISLPLARMKMGDRRTRFFTEALAEIE